MSETEMHFPPVPRQHYGNPKLTADWVIAHAMKGYSAGLCSQSDARSMAWSQYVKAMGLRPQMDAKDFYKIFDRQWEMAYIGPRKMEPSHEPKAKAEGSTQWVKVTSVDMVWRVNPKDRNDNSVYFTVNGGGKTHTYIAEGGIADYIAGFYSNQVHGAEKRRELVSEQLNRLAQKVIDKLAGKASEPAPATPPVLTAPPELTADVQASQERRGEPQGSSRGVLRKGDTERARQLQRKEQDTIIQKGTMVYDVLYSRNAIVARVNKKTYTLQSVDGLKFTHDKTWVNRLDDQTVPQNLIQYAGTKKKPAVKKPAPAPDLPPALTAPPELTADVLGVGQPPTAAPKPKAALTPAQIALHGYGYVPPPPALTAPPERTAGMYGAGAASTVTENIEQLERRTGRKYPRTKKELEAHQTWNVEITRGTKTFMGKSEPQVTVYTKIPGMGHPGIGTTTALAIWDFCNKNKLPPLPKKQPTTVAPGRKPAPAPNLPPILTAPPELTADVFGTGPMGLTPTPAAPKARKPKARKPKTKVAATPKAKPKATKPKAKPKATKPKAKTPAAAPKLTAAQREHLAIQGFVMVKRGGKYVKITR